MKELPGDVFVTGQLMPAQLAALAEQGVMSIINNRPDFEAPLQPASDEMEQAALSASIDYLHIPMAGALTPGLIEASMTAYDTTPRPIVAYCASGMRSAALWAFAHVDRMGIDSVMQALSDAGYSLEQIRQPLMEFAARDRTC